MDTDQEPFDLQQGPGGQLILKRPGQPDVDDVRLRRAFPWSNPDELISIRAPDGRELLLIQSLKDLPQPLRQRVLDTLHSNSFIPRITQVKNVDVQFGYQVWTVVTDRGPVEFRVQEREDVRFLPDQRFAIKDADGNIYELPPLDTLDDASRRAIEPLL